GSVLTFDTGEARIGSDHCRKISQNFSPAGVTSPSVALVAGPSFIGSSSKHERPTRPISTAKVLGWEICSTFCSRGPDRSVHERKHGTLVFSFSVRSDGRREDSRARGARVQ